MESIEEKIKKFLKVSDGYGDGSGDGYGDGSGYGSGDGSGYGSGDGDGYGYGYGSGSGYGSGDGYGDGSGDGYGSGSGYGSGDGYGDGSGDGYGDGSGYGSGDGDGYGDGYGDGSGDGYGSGSGYGSGDGDGYGYGYGSGLKSINKKLIYLVDGVQTIFSSIIGNVAKGSIVNKDLTLFNCYVLKGKDCFAHGKTLEEANQSLRDKIFSKLNVEERIKEFKKQFNCTDKYNGKDFFNWHNLLTWSCLQGRESFVKNNEIDLDKKYTVREFIEICKNSYGGEVIKELEKYYK